MKINSKTPVIGTPSLGVDTVQCSECGITYPEELQMFYYSEGRHQNSCPECALKDRNRIHGFPLDKPYHGPMAKDLYDRFMEFKKGKYDKTT